MTMDISSFRNSLGAGGARPNQFLVTLAFPALVRDLPRAKHIDHGNVCGPSGIKCQSLRRAI